MPHQQLFKLLTAHFDDGELRTLCFELHIDYDSLSGQNRDAKARELILRCRREGRVEDLVKKCRELRPHITWPDAHAGDGIEGHDPIFFVPTSLPAEYVRREEAVIVNRKS